MLAGKRVLALTMPGLLDDLDGLELIGMNADAVLIGGADESEETGPRLLVPEPQPRVPRARARAPSSTACTGTAGGRRATGRGSTPARSSPGSSTPPDIEATVLGKPSPEYFAAALEALDADPELTWMVGDDLEGDIAGAQRHGMRTVLVRTGQVPARRSRAHARRCPTGSSPRSRSCPTGSRQNP